jgi:hypothetical protein
MMTVKTARRPKIETKIAAPTAAEIEAFVSMRKKMAKMKSALDVLQEKILDFHKQNPKVSIGTEKIQLGFKSINRAEFVMPACTYTRIDWSEK